MSRHPVLAVVLAALLQCLPQTALGATVPVPIDRLEPRSSLLERSPAKPSYPEKVTAPGIVKAPAPVVSLSDEADDAEESTAKEPSDKEARRQKKKAAREAYRAEQRSMFETLGAKIDSLRDTLVEKTTKTAPADTNSEVAEDESESRTADSEASESDEGFVELDLEGAKSALGGDRFGVFARDGQLHISYKTTDACGRNLETSREAKGFRLRIPKSCLNPSGDLQEFKEPLGMATPTKTTTVCLVSDKVHEGVLRLGEESTQCEELFRVVSKEDAAKEAAAEKARLAEEHKAEALEALQGIISDCGGSNALSDKIAAYTAVERSGYLMGKDEAEEAKNKLRTAIAKKSLTDAAALRITGLDKLEEDVLPILRKGDEKHQIAAFEFKKKALLNRIFNDSTTTLEEKRAAYEEALAQLEEEAVNLDADDEKVSKIVEGFKSSSTAKLAQLDRSEKVGKANEELPAAKQALLEAMQNGNPQQYRQAEMAYVQLLNRHGQSLGCGTKAGADTNECKGLTGLGREISSIHQTRGQIDTHRILAQQCQVDKAKDANAKCEPLAKHEQLMRQNPVLGGTPAQQQQTASGAPALTLPTFPGAAAPPATTGFDLTRMTGSDLQFMQNSMDAAGTQQNPQTQQTPRNPAMNPAPQTPPPVAPVQQRTTARRGN